MDDFEEIKTRQQKQVIPVVDAMPADLLTPLAVYLKLSKDEPNSFLLESVEGGETLARYSFIGARPEMIFGGDNRTVHIADGAGERTLGLSIVSFLRQLLDSSLKQDSELPSFIGGAIGYLGFHCAEWFETSLKLKPEGGADDARFMYFTSIVTFDHAKQTIKIISLVLPEQGSSEEDLRVAMVEARNKNRAIRSALESGEIERPGRESTVDAGQVESNWARAEFEESIRAIKELIAAGECYQVVLSQCFSKRTVASPVAIYRALRSLNPSPYMFLLKFADRAIIGASPEMLVRCRGRELEYRPIAGTRPRGRTAEEDSALAAEMRTDKKEVAEHMMLVDLGRNDLGRVSEFGSIEVTSLMHVEKYSHVQHLVSSITSRMRDGKDRFDALAACFPAGTVSGAPKVRAIEIISKLEPTPRGVYSGAIGYFDFAGNMDTCIAIRTLVLENGIAKVQAGAGIVADSIPENEFDETVNKARALLKTLEIAEAGDF
jgi:anthranilate synthase component 1